MIQVPDLYFLISYIDFCRGIFTFKEYDRVEMSIMKMNLMLKIALSSDNSSVRPFTTSINIFVSLENLIIA